MAVSFGTIRYDIVLRPQPGDHGLTEAVIGTAELDLTGAMTIDGSGQLSVRADVAMARVFREIAAGLDAQADAMLNGTAPVEG